VILDDIQKRFLKFHAENEHVYKLLVRFAREAKASGRESWGMKAIYERARWEVAIVTKGTEFKLSNDFTSRYARLIMQQEADLAGFFDIRELRSQRGMDDSHDLPEGNEDFSDMDFNTTV
jgi:hypothetical protein